MGRVMVKVAGRMTRPSRPWGGWKIVLLMASTAIAVVSFFQVLGTPYLDRNWSLQVSLIAIVWFAVFLACSYGHFKTPYLFASAYALALILFHLGITIPLSFGWIDVAGWSSGSFAKWIERAGWYTVLSLACFGIGFALAMHRRGVRRGGQIADRDRLRWTLAIVHRDGIGLLLASVVFFGLAIASFGDLLKYSRVDFFRGVGDTRGLGVFLMVFPSSLVLLVIGAQTKVQKITSALAAFAGFILIMLSGYRTEALYPLLVGVVLWVKLGRRIPLVVAGSSVVAILFAISLIGILRSVSAYDQINSHSFETAAKHATIANSMITMGQTGGLLAHVLQLVPKHAPYRYGTTYLEALEGSLPNVMPKIAKSTRARLTEEAMTDSRVITRLAPHNWLTYELEPGKFYRGEGVGFTGIGEPYLNFGVTGVVVFFIVLGFLLGRLDGADLTGKPALLIFSGAMLWHLTLTVRDDFSNFIKPSIFILIILIIWRLFANVLMPIRSHEK